MTIAAPPREDLLVTVNAQHAATAWLNAFLATGDDPDRAVLFRTLVVEFFPEGVQLIACSGVALFRSWLPRSDLEGTPTAWPALAEVPRRRVIVMDVERFAVGFMKILHQVTSTEERAFESLTLSIAPQDEGATLSLGEEFVSERLILRSCGQRLDLRLMDGVYPDWRALQLGIDDRERVEGIAFGPRIVGLVGKLKGCAQVRFEFHGTERYVGFEAGATGDAPPAVRGILMPMRKTDRDTSPTPPDSPPTREQPGKKGKRARHLASIRMPDGVVGHLSVVE